MPFRLDENRTTIHFITFAEMPSMVYEACCLTGTPSNTRYAQEAVARRLSEDLGLSYDDLIAKLPPTRRQARVFNGQRAIGPANTVESVR